MMNKWGSIISVSLIVAALFVISCNSKKDQESTDKKGADSSIQTKGNSLLLRDASDERGMVLESPDGLFIVTFPGQPMYHSQLVPVAKNVDVEMVSYIYEVSANESYMIAYCDYPANAVTNDPYELLETARSGAVMNNVVESVSKSEVDGWPAITTKSINKETGYYYILRVILADNRLYQVQMLNKGRYSSEAAVQMFMESFTVTMAH